MRSFCKFDDGMIHECDYKDIDSYQVTEMFINNREYLLKRLAVAACIGLVIIGAVDTLSRLDYTFKVWYLLSR